ncbi:hypothetical protein [Myroides sp. LJL110]
MGCTKASKIELLDPVIHGGQLYQGYFLTKDSIKIPLQLGIRQDNPDSQIIEGYIVSGDQLTREYITKKKDSFIMKSGMHGFLKGVFLHDSLIAGELQNGIGKNKTKTPFVIYKSNKQDLVGCSNLTKINIQGTWELEFEKLPDKFSLDYDIRQIKQIDMYSSDHIALARAYTPSSAVQGFQGVLTSKGFKMASFHSSQPFLFCGEFIDQDNFVATINTATESYDLKGKRKASFDSDLEYTNSVIKGFILFLKGFFQR